MTAALGDGEIGVTSREQRSAVTRDPVLAYAQSASEDDGRMLMRCSDEWCGGANCGNKRVWWFDVDLVEQDVLLSR